MIDAYIDWLLGAWCSFKLVKICMNRQKQFVPYTQDCSAVSSRPLPAELTAIVHQVLHNRLLVIAGSKTMSN